MTTATTTAIGVTPAVAQYEVDAILAAELLTHNTNNRLVRPPFVTGLARDIVEGRWSLTGDCIAIDTHGRLVNGQHRLLAILEAAEFMPQVRVPLFVATGVPVESFAVMDQGRLRSTGTILHTQGFSGSNVVAAMTKQVLLYDGYRDQVWSSSIPISRSEILRYALDHKEDLTAARPWSPRAKFVLNTTSYVTLRYLVNRDSQQPEETWNAFHEGILIGADLAPGDPRLVLRNTRLTGTWGNSGAQPRLGAYIKAWNLFVSGQTTRLLTFRVSELPLPDVM